MVFRCAPGQAIIRKMTKLCSECGAPFDCVQAEGCWCAQLPWQLPVPADAAAGSAVEPARDCLCPNCLRARLGLEPAEASGSPG